MNAQSIQNQEETLFNSGFISITIINFIVFLVYYCFVVITASYATKELHSTVAEAGFATGIYIIGTLFARLIMGQRLELIGRKEVLRYGAIFYFLTTLAYLIAKDILILDAVRFLNGFAYGTVSTAANAVVTAYIPKSKDGEGINYYGLSTSLAAAIGPFIGMILLPAVGFTWIIYLAVLLSIGVAIACLRFPVQNLSLSSTEAASMKSWSLKNFIEPRVAFISFLGFLMGLAYSSVLGFLSIFTHEIGLITAGAFFFVVYALVITVTRPIAGRIFDERGENAVMYPSYVCLTIGLLLIAYSSNASLLLIAGAFVGLGYGTFMSNGQAICLKAVEPAKIGVALSTYFIGLDLGLGVGPYTLGILHGLLSYSGIYMVSAIIPVIVLILYAIYYKPVKKEAIYEEEIPQHQ